MTKTKKQCRHPGCTKPRWGRGMLSEDDVCSGHYQRERRLIAKAKEEGRPVSEEEINQLLGSVRAYGDGSNQVSTRVTNEKLGWLNAMALRRYPMKDESGRTVGDVSALLREIISLFMEGNSADPGQFLDEEPQEHGDVHEHAEHGVAIAG
jgi:hypothetical protein